MNSFLFILYSFSFNVSDFISNMMRYAFDPYTSLFGNLTWGIIFGFLGAGLFVGNRSTTMIFTYLVIVGIVFAAILPSALLGIFGLIVAFIGTVALYVAFVTSRHV